MKKSVAITLGLCVAASLVATKPCSAGFAVGGENGWQLTTDGIVDVFATYDTTSKVTGAKTTAGGLDWLDSSTDANKYNQRFGVGVGLLPSVVAFNIKAPTTNGVDSTVRVGIYPSIQNGGAQNASFLQASDRFSTGPNIDFREIFYTAKGKYGEILAGRALNLFQGKNILTDMTLLTAGTVGGRGNTVTLGHIGFGYLYTGFGPQMRYTTPEFGGAKFAIEIAEPYSISSIVDNNGLGATVVHDKTNLPRVEAEFSFAKTFNSGASTQAWLSGMWAQATRSSTDTFRPGGHLQSIGGAYGIGGGFKGLNLLFSGYGGKGLGMISTQDGTLGSTDSYGSERLFWGFLAQATYKINPSWMVGINYGQNNLVETKNDTADRIAGAYAATKRQESGVATVTYNMNSFTQFVLEYIYARQTWHDGASQHSNQFAFGTMFYW